jgi:uncharacterized repeat protein (TIGR01451 family)
MRGASRVLLLSAALGAAESAQAVPVLTLTKVASPPLVSRGDLATYVLILANQGTTTATSVTVSDTLPAGLTWSTSTTGCAVTSGVLSCSFSSLPASAALQISVTASTAGAACGLYSNTATAGVSNAGGVGSNSAVIDVACPDLALHQDPDAPSRPSGEPIGFRLALVNKGLGVARGVTLDDLLPSGLAWSLDPAAIGCAIGGGGELTCSFGDLAPRAGVALHVSAPTPQACGLFVSHVTANATNGTADADSSASERVVVPGDVNRSCATDVSDVFHLINFLFAGGPAPL